MIIEMYQNVMNHLQIDKYRELIIEQDQKITELEKENADLQKSYEELYNSMRIIKDQRNVLEKENAELKEKYVKNITDCDICDTYCNSQFTKAKEIIREFVEWATWQGSNCPNFKSIQDKAEQFLNEVDK